jgi:glyoxylase-like metal-dependent hydrolase (beta-lactamase superfamily II)
MKWLIGIGVVLAALAGLAWFVLLDANGPARAEGEFDLSAYRALVAQDAPETLPTEVRVEFVGASETPGFAAEAGAFSGGERTFSYTAFQVIAPGGDIIIDGAVDEASLAEISDGEGRFTGEAYNRVLDAMTRAGAVLITHEHLDHVMAVARHPDPSAIAPRLVLTRPQLDGLAEHAPNSQLAAEIAAVAPIDLAAPTRIAPGVVAVAAPGHSPGTILIYVRGAAREYLFIGDIAWVMESVEHVRGRPRFVTWILPGVDIDRPAVLRQLRALHDIAAANPDLVIVPAHDDRYLRETLLAGGTVQEGFVAPPSNDPAPH